MMWPDIGAIEIGGLSSPKDLETVLAAVAAQGIAWAMHMPLWRSRPRRVPVAPSGLSAEEERYLREDMATGSRRHASYALVHAPWLPSHSLPEREARAIAQGTVDFLAELALAHDLPLALELKLGLQRDPGVLAYFLAAPDDFLDLQGGTFCVDTGDWVLACEALELDPVRAFAPFAARTSVLHVHAVERATQPYLWRPIHPTDPDAVTMLRLCQVAQAAREELTVVFEHTPHLDPGPDYDLEGYAWLLSSLL